MELNEIKKQGKWTDISDALNENFAKVSAETQRIELASRKNKGYYATYDELTSIVPQGSMGDIAFIGTKYPYRIYKWNGTAWIDTFETGGEQSVNLADYYTRREVDEKVETNKEGIELLNANTGVSEYPEFSEAKAYAVGDVVLFEGKMYRFTSAHEAGAWDAGQVEDWSERKKVSLNSETLDYLENVIADKEETLSAKESFTVSTLNAAGQIIESTRSDSAVNIYDISELESYLIDLTTAQFSYMFAIHSDNGTIDVASTREGTRRKLRTIIKAPKGATTLRLSYSNLYDIKVIRVTESYLRRQDIEELDENLNHLDIQVNGADESVTFDFTASRQTKSLPFTIFKGQTINLSGDITVITCRTYNNDAEYQTVENGTIADRNINYIKNANETGSLTLNAHNKGILQEINSLNEGLGKLEKRIDYRETSLEEIETVASSYIKKDGYIGTSGTATTTVGVYNVADLLLLNVSMKTGNQYSLPYKFYDINGVIINDDNTFPTVTGSGIVVSDVPLSVPNGAELLKITYNNTENHQILSVASKFVFKEELAKITSGMTALEESINASKEGAGIAYRLSSKLRQRPIKILAVGNSWTKNATMYLPDILTSLGIKVEVSTSYASSATLASYWSNIQLGSAIYQFRKWTESTGWVTQESVSYKDIFASDEWDIITHQQQSGNGGNYPSFQPYLHDIITWEKNLAKIMPLFFMHATWAYPNGYENEQFETLYGSDTSVMYNAVLEAYSQAMVDENIVNVMPSTPIIQQVREQGIPNVDTSDGGSHLAVTGQFAASCVWAEMLLRYYFDKSLVTDIDITKSTFAPDSVSESDAVIIRQLAKDIVANVTDYFPNQNKG